MMANQRQKTSSLASRPPSFGSADNDDSSLSSDDKKECLLRKLSASFLTRRPSSSRFSMIALSENLADLLQREGISQQVKAAKAVGLILCCFLFCWFPFLLVCSQSQKSNPPFPSHIPRFGQFVYFRLIPFPIELSDFVFGSTMPVPLSIHSFMPFPIQKCVSLLVNTLLGANF